jgi:ferredoxin-type protein NapG
MDRRGFIGTGAQAAAAAACGGLAWYALLAQQARAAAPLRPPGARAEAEFAATCIRCGQCVQACPYRTLKLSTVGGPWLAGTPAFVPREVPCYMCENIPCVRVCPTGALDARMPEITRARMGLAVIDQESCLSWQGLRCEVCHRVCPVRDKAITISTHQREISKHAMFVPAIHSDACTGCGICENKCPTQVAAIRIVDRKLVQGRIGEHYRLGWKHEAPPEAAASPPGEPLRPAAPAGVPPAGPRALDYLNRGGTP